MKSRHTRVLGLVAALTLSLALLPAGAGGAAPVAMTSLNMEWRTGLPSVTGSSMAFFERVEDGEPSRYVAVGQMGYGVQFLDITDPLAPVPVGFHLSPGVNYHTDVHVNVTRDIMVINVDFPGTNLAMGLGTGVEFVDIADLSAPQRLGVVQDLEGPHKMKLIGDHHVYTTLPTYVIDYADPENPVDLGRVDEVCAHGLTLDPTQPTTAYHASCQSWKWQIVDVSQPAEPVLLTEVRDLDIDTPHSAASTPDSGLVAISDLRADYTEVECPGGGMHFYDIGGDVADGASPVEPRKIGTWFAPYTGARNDPTASDPYGSCTLHGFEMNAERPVIATGNYTGGAWLVDVEEATDNRFLEEYSAEPERGRGPTTWGNTIGGHVSAGDFTWYLQWAPFDDPAYEHLLYSVSPTSGFEVFEFTGELPPKMSHLTVDGDGDGAVAGRLGRYPLLTADGWESLPLAGQDLQVSAGDRTVTVTTAEDGTYLADLGLAPGSHEVTVRWAGDDTFRETTTTAVVTVQ